MRVRYLRSAAADLREQVAYYRGKAPGLDKLFRNSIQRAEHLILSNPQGFACVAEDTEIRSVVVRRFPFRLLYALREGGVLVVAVAHTAREPSQFLDRL